MWAALFQQLIVIEISSTDFLLKVLRRMLLPLLQEREPASFKIPDCDFDYDCRLLFVARSSELLKSRRADIHFPVTSDTSQNVQPYLREGVLKTDLRRRRGKFEPLLTKIVNTRD